MRRPEEIKEEITKVRKAEKGAQRKLERCKMRLKELEAELKETEEDEKAPAGRQPNASALS